MGTTAMGEESCSSGKGICRVWVAACTHKLYTALKSYYSWQKTDQLQAFSEFSSYYYTCFLCIEEMEELYAWKGSPRSLENHPLWCVCVVVVVVPGRKLYRWNYIEYGTVNGFDLKRNSHWQWEARRCVCAQHDRLGLGRILQRGHSSIHSAAVSVSSPKLTTVVCFRPKHPHF